LNWRSRLLSGLLQTGFWLPFLICTWFALVPQPPDIPVFRVGDVVLHAFAFTYLSFSLLLAYQARTLLQCFLLMLCYGVLIELLQSLEIERDAELKDLLVDLAGIACGLLLAKVAADPLRNLLGRLFSTAPG